MHPKQLGEFGLIERWARRLESRPEVLLGIGDDAAILSAIEQPVVTCDALVEGTHFRLDWTTPRALGRKAMAVNVSDVAAMGARPVAAFVSLAIPPGLDVEFLDELYAGFDSAARQWKFTVAGGDTTRSKSGLFLSITLIGAVPPERAPLRRDGAQSGDVVLVTGTLGDAAAGLHLLQQPSQFSDEEAHQQLLDRHFDPTPRLAEMEAMLASDFLSAIHAAVDVSDGVAGDAAHIARRSNLDIELDVSSLPISDVCRTLATRLSLRAEDWALGGGEDYELLLCVAPQAAPHIARHITQVSGTAVTAIGNCGAASSEMGRVFLRHSDGRREVAGSGWAHF